MADTLIESIAGRYVLKESTGKLWLTLFSVEDVFSILTTGYGKSSYCACLPESLVHSKNKSTIYSGTGLLQRLSSTRLQLGSSQKPCHQQILTPGKYYIAVALAITGSFFLTVG